MTPQNSGTSASGPSASTASASSRQLSPRPRAVLCLSGGMDSSVCAALAARDYETYALHFSYGQRTEARELRSAQAVSLHYGITLMPLRIDLFRKIGGSALTDAAIAVPNAAPDFAGVPLPLAPEPHPATSVPYTSPAASEVPVTYVPFRNAHFLAAAVSWAEVLGAHVILIGAVEQDSSGYPDCRPAYYDAFNTLIGLGTREESAIRIETPLIHLRKSQIVELGVELSAPFHVTWSCYSGETVACGVCESCVLRLQAFRAAGAVDPIPYATL